MNRNQQPRRLKSQTSQRHLSRTAVAVQHDRDRDGALSLLTSGDARDAFDLEKESPKRLDAYGRNVFGASMLMARRLVEVSVRMVQVNLGRGSAWRPVPIIEEANAAI